MDIHSYNCMIVVLLAAWSLIGFLTSIGISSFKDRRPFVVDLFIIGPFAIILIIIVGAIIDTFHIVMKGVQS